MKVVVIGGVAAGTKTAAKLKREHPQDAVTIYTKGSDISYAGCGLRRKYRCLWCKWSRHPEDAPALTWQRFWYRQRRRR